MFIYLMAIDDYNDRIKFVTIYENYLQKMQFVAESILNDSSEAENIVHDTFLVIIDNLNKIDEADCHKTWNYIVTILKNRCFNVLKRNKKIVYLDDYTIFNEKIGKTNEEAMIEKESVSCMVELIRNMKSPYKEVLYLKYYNEMNLREIAEDLQMNYDNVRQILVKGRKKLKEKMKESGYFYEDESDI